MSKCFTYFFSSYISIPILYYLQSYKYSLYIRSFISKPIKVIFKCNIQQITFDTANIPIERPRNFWSKRIAYF